MKNKHQNKKNQGENEQINESQRADEKQQTGHYNPRAKYERTNNRKKRLLAALVKSMGVVSTACVMTGIPRSAFYTWVHKDAEFARAVHEVDERSKDFVESKMYELVNEKNPRIIEFYLSTRCRDRGYGKEPQENKQVTVNISTEEMSY